MMSVLLSRCALEYWCVAPMQISANSNTKETDDRRRRTVLCVVLVSTVKLFSPAAQKKNPTHFWGNVNSPSSAKRRQQRAAVWHHCAYLLQHDCHGGLILPRSAATSPPSAAKKCPLRRFLGEADVFVHSPKPCQHTQGGTRQTCERRAAFDHSELVPKAPTSRRSSCVQRLFSIITA